MWLLEKRSLTFTHTTAHAAMARAAELMPLLHQLRALEPEFVNNTALDQALVDYATLLAIQASAAPQADPDDHEAVLVRQQLELANMHLIQRVLKYKRQFGLR